METADNLNFSVDIAGLYRAVANKDKEGLRKYFEPDAKIYWPNTKEIFTVDEFIEVNCEYPGAWQVKVETVKSSSGAINKRNLIAVAKVWNNSGTASRSVAFIQLSSADGGLIERLTEYWGDIEEPPKWRTKLGIGERYRD